jgi:hypothetical protein
MHFKAPRMQRQPTAKKVLSTQSHTTFSLNKFVSKDLQYIVANDSPDVGFSGFNDFKAVA